VRGLKLLINVSSCVSNGVAPFTGAWIETFHVLFLWELHKVAPFTGAWIETLLPLAIMCYLPRRTLHGCVD